MEHNVRAVMGLSDRVAVINFGKKIAEGRPSEIAQNGEVIQPTWGVPMMLLEVKNIVVHYGKGMALKGVSLSMERGIPSP